MPPKKGGGTTAQKVQKVVEDKTFGMKNKNKSKKVQEYIKSVETSAKNAARGNAEAERQRNAARAAAKAAKEEAELFGDVFVRKSRNERKKEVENAVDPKMQICPEFMAGRCSKGDKCKFSHDATLERKQAKRNIYEDSREADTIDTWDLAKLELVVGQKQKGTMPATDIVCKYFLDAIEKNNYGWLWECPNGPKCHYRHALPPGFVFAPKKKSRDDAVEEVDIGEEIEAKRKLLDISKCTPVTAESFAAWKERREAERAAKAEAERLEASKKKDEKLSRGAAAMSGRALFAFNPALFEDDEGAAGGDELVLSAGAVEDDEEAEGVPLDEAEAEPESDDGEGDDGADPEDGGDDGEEEEEDDGVKPAAAKPAAPAAVAAPVVAKAEKADKKDKKDKAEKKDKKDKKDKDDKKDKKEKKDKKDKKADPNVIVLDASLFDDSDSD